MRTMKFFKIGLVLALICIVGIIFILSRSPQEYKTQAEVARVVEIWVSGSNPTTFDNRIVLNFADGVLAGTLVGNENLPWHGGFGVHGDYDSIPYVSIQLFAADGTLKQELVNMTDDSRSDFVFSWSYATGDYIELWQAEGQARVKIMMSDGSEAQMSASNTIDSGVLKLYLNSQ